MGGDIKNYITIEGNDEKGDKKNQCHGIEDAGNDYQIPINSRKSYFTGNALRRFLRRSHSRKYKSVRKESKSKMTERKRNKSNRIDTTSDHIENDSVTKKIENKDNEKYKKNKIAYNNDKKSIGEKLKNKRYRSHSFHSRKYKKIKLKMIVK